MRRGRRVWVGGSKGAPLAQCARSATIWVFSDSRIPYFVILGASLLFYKSPVASSALGIWKFTQFHPFSPITYLHPLFFHTFFCRTWSGPECVYVVICVIFLFLR